MTSNCESCGCNNQEGLCHLNCGHSLCVHCHPEGHCERGRDMFKCPCLWYANNIRESQDCKSSICFVAAAVLAATTHRHACSSQVLDATIFCWFWFVAEGLIKVRACRPNHRDSHFFDRQRRKLNVQQRNDAKTGTVSMLFLCSFTTSIDPTKRLL